VTFYIIYELGSECDIRNIGLVIADNKNEDSILEMCRQAKVVVNCVGPVSFVILLFFIIEKVLYNTVSRYIDQLCFAKYVYIYIWSEISFLSPLF